MANGFDFSSLDNLGGLITDQFGKPSQGDSTDKAAVESEDDQECKTTGVTDEGIIKSAKWKAIINGAILAYNTLNSMRMAKLQRDLGQRYLKLAQDHRDYYRTNFMPLEVSLTIEAAQLPKYVRDKEQMYKGQMLTSVKFHQAGQVDSAISCTGRYCTGQRAAILTEQLLKNAVTESLTAGLAYRYTDKEEIAHNNLRWEKREQVQKIGRDIPAEAVSYASLASGIFGRLGEQAGKAAEGAFAFFGRGEPQYPPRRPPITVSEYRYSPTPLETFKPRPPETYTKPSPPEIKLSQ